MCDPAVGRFGLTGVKAQPREAAGERDPVCAEPLNYAELLEPHLLFKGAFAMVYKVQ